MDRPHPGSTPLLIRVSPVPGKYASHLILLPQVFSLRLWGPCPSVNKTIIKADEENAQVIIKADEENAQVIIKADEETAQVIIKADEENAQVNRKMQPTMT